MNPAELPFVSVAIPTRNRADMLATCLRGLTSQDYPHDRYEVIVVDDGSKDGTASVVRKVAAEPGSPVVRYLAQRHLGPNAARNAALRLSHGDPVCFVDDDVVVPSGWLAALVTGAIGHPTAGCVGGPIRLRLEGRPPRSCGREALGESELDLGDHSHEVRYVWGANMAVRRHALAAIGPFQEHRLPGHDEVEWLDRLNQAHIPVLYVADALVWHRRTAADLRLTRMLRKRFVRGVGETFAYHRAGFAYPVGGMVASLRGEFRHAISQRCGVGLIQAAQAAGRLAGLAPLRVTDLLRGRRHTLAPPPA